MTLIPVTPGQDTARVSAQVVTFSTLLLCLSLNTSFLNAQNRGGQKVEYAGDLRALIEELDRGYPFFPTKNIVSDWKRTKARVLKEVRSCRNDDQFFGLVTRILECLRDGHAELRDVRPKLKPRTRDSYPGVAFLPASGGRVVVMSTVVNLRSILPVGTIVTRIDGQNARKYLEARAVESWKKGGSFSSPQRARFWEFRLPLSGARGTRFTIHYLAGRKEKKIVLTANREVKSWEHNYNLPDNLQRAGKSVYHSRLENGCGYLWLRRMDESVEPGIATAIGTYANVPGWIVDLRGNTGGGYEPSLKSTIAGFQGPVAVILDAGTVSAAETFARDLVNVNQARLFGSTSAGSSSSKKLWEFPSGVAKLRYSVRSRMGVNNTPLEFHGVQPDEEIEAVPEELFEGKNTEILRAVAWLEKQSAG